METKCYRFGWVKAGDALAIPKKQRKLHNMKIAICEYSGRVAKIANSMLEVIVIQDMYHTDGVCEEERCCLDFDCPLNKTTWDSWKASGKAKPRSRKPKGFGERISFNRRNGSNGMNDFSDLFTRD
jgi:hypothetical protein